MRVAYDKWEKFAISRRGFIIVYKEYKRDKGFQKRFKEYKEFYKGLYLHL